uniref:Uncharacterized protein n=1 Tax=Anguilla anguilla TaxID=7936 RepID=A0A0E9XX89_ANGAN
MLFVLNNYSQVNSSVQFSRVKQKCSLNSFILIHIHFFVILNRKLIFCTYFQWRLNESSLKNNYLFSLVYDNLG